MSRLERLVRSTAMKKFLLVPWILGAFALALPARPARAQIEASFSIGGFHDELAPYGRWEDCRYGQCWIPEHVASNWQPYTNGQWVYTEYGWTWVSDDPWGSSPYHYGTWASLGPQGWCWIPGSVWAPAWVTWSYSDNYVGWAPLPPTATFGASGYFGGAIVVSASQYVFVPTNRFVGVNVASVRVSSQQNATIFRQTTHATQFAVSGGILRNTAIPVSAIQRAGVRVETRGIADARTSPRPMTSAGAPGHGGRFNVVAPAREVNAAFQSRQHGSSPAEPSHGNPPAKEARPESGNGGQPSNHGPASAQESSRPAHEIHAAPGKTEHRSARPQQQEQPAASSHEVREQPAQHGRAEPPPSNPHRQAAPPGHSQDAPARTQEAPRGHAAAAPPAHSGPPAAVHGKGKKADDKGKNDKDEKDRKD
jgi:hypothetical protein